MTSSASQQAKFEQLANICKQLTQHENELVDKTAELEQHKSSHEEMANRLEQLRQRLQQKKPAKKARQRDFDSELDGFNEQLNQLEEDIVKEKEQQRERQTADEEQIQKQIRTLSNTELKLRSGKSQTPSPISAKKDTERTLSDLSRSVQRKELKLKQTKLMNQRSEMSSAESSPRARQEQAHSRQLHLKVRALEAHIESLRFKKQNECKLRLDELEHLEKHAEPSKKPRHHDPQTIERLQTLLRDLQREQGSLGEGASRDKLAIVQLTKEKKQLIRILEQQSQQEQQIPEVTMQDGDTIAQLLEKNLSQRNELQFIDQSTANLQDLNEQLNRLLVEVPSSQPVVERQSPSEDLTPLRQAIAIVSSSANELQAALKAHFVQGGEVESMKQQVKAEEEALVQLQEAERERQQINSALATIRATSANVTIKPLEEIQALKKNGKQLQDRIVAKTRLNIRMRDQIQEIREKYGLFTQQSLPTERSNENDKTTSKQEETKQTDRPATSGRGSSFSEQATITKCAAPQTFEEYVAIAYFRHRKPSHQIILSRLVLLSIIVPTIAALKDLLL